MLACMNDMNDTIDIGECRTIRRPKRTCHSLRVRALGAIWLVLVPGAAERKQFESPTEEDWVPSARRCRP